MNRMARSFLNLFTVVILITSISCEPSTREHYIKYPMKLPVVSQNGGSQLNGWLKSCNKVVIFMHVNNMINPDWKHYMNTYPDTRFIFFIKAKDSAKIPALLTKLKIDGHPVFLDKEGEFLAANDLQSDLTFISFIVNAENRVIAMSNPSLPNFEKILKSLKDCH